MSTILVTGAGRGLGYELARQYAAEGWRVIGIAESPITGPAGNKEFLLYARKSAL